MRGSRWFVVGTVCGLFAWMFWDVLTAGHLFVYRDAAHFYYPLFQLVQEEWTAGRVPLWNPYENSGSPLAANATASVFYPVKLIFALPLSYDATYRLYILLHVLLSAGTMYLLARRWKSSVEAAGLAALSYAFCGNVLFQYCNVVFLCGAAWLPLAVWTGVNMLERRGLAWAGGLAVTLAMMALAGDPQMAYLAGLLLALFALLLWRSDRAQQPIVEKLKPAGKKARRKGRQPPDDRQPDEPPRSPRQRLWQHRLALLAAAAVGSLLLSAVQIVPTLELSRRSVRAQYDVPRNVYEFPGWLARDFEPMPRFDTGLPPQWYDELVGNPPPPRAHHDQIYEFSVGPWRLAEYLWPNCAGRQFPTHRRWMDALPAEAAIWVPSLYMGLLPLLLALCGWKIRRTDPRTAWLSWMLLLSVLASFGRFGLGWLAHEVYQVTGGNPELLKFGPEVGGLYWLLTVLLPGFVSFRFPGKLLVLAALAGSLLAAGQWDQWQEQSWRWSRWAARTAAASGVALVVVLAASGFWNAWLADAKPDSYFGPLDANGAWWDLCGAVVHTLLLGIVFWWLLRPACFQHWGSGRLGACALLLTAIDLAVANGWMIATAPAELWHDTPALAEAVDGVELAFEDDAQPYRVFRVSSWSPPAWSEEIDSERQLRGLAWDRATLFPKYNLAPRISLVQTSGTLQLYEYELFWSSSRRSHPPEFVQPRRAIDAWGSKYLIIPRTHTADDPFRTLTGLRTQWLEPQWKPDRPQGAPLGPALDSILPPDSNRELPAVDVRYNPGAFARSWIVHRVHAVAPIDRQDRARLQTVMQSILFPVNSWLDLRHEALVEDADVAAALGGSSRAFPEFEGESCRIAEHGPQRVVIEAHLQSPGLVVLADVYYPGWQLEIEHNGQTYPGDILRTNRMMRGAMLPEAGDYRLIYTYRPLSFSLGLALSGLGWLTLLAGGPLAWLRARNRRNTAPP